MGAGPILEPRGFGPLQAGGHLRRGQVRWAFPSYTRSILTAIYLCHPCSYFEILRTETPGQVLDAGRYREGDHRPHAEGAPRPADAPLPGGAGRLRHLAPAGCGVRCVLLGGRLD
jgi:hypothetical protein